jgi:DNA-binding IclR family transcriptional regulator
LNGEIIMKVNSSSVKAKKDSMATESGLDESDGKDPLFVTALARGLDILRCFTPEREVLGSREIARLTGLPQPTVWRLCHTLLKLGYLVPGMTPNKLRVGSGVLLLGHAAITRTGLSAFALPLMRQVAERHKISVTLAERNGTDMLILQRIEVPSMLTLNLHVGTNLDLGNSSLGWTYLCAVDAATRDIALKQLKKRDPEGFDKIRLDLAIATKEFAQWGFVFNLGRSHPDINAVGVPVISPDGKKVMALTSGGAKSSVTKTKLLNEVAPALKELALNLSPMLN